MKRILLSVLIIVIAASCIYAANLQSIYTTRDDVYRRVDALCTRAGVIGPSTFSPVPARALTMALDRIDREALSIEDRNEYDRLYSILTGEEYIFKDGYFTFDLNAGVNIGVNLADYRDFDYANTRSDAPQWDHRENTLVPYRYETGLLSFGLKMTFGDHIYIDGLMELKNRNQVMLDSTLALLFTTVKDEGGNALTGISSEWPQRAGASVGNEYFNLILGRFPHSIGGGITGNLLVGDNFNYQEVLNLSLMSNHFSYNISITRFDQQAALPTAWYSEFTRSKFSGPQQFRVVHRFDINVLDRFRFALNLATIYNSTYGLDFRFFYPFVVSHNYWNYSNDMERHDYDEANNFMTFEFEWNISRGLTFTGQLAVDQMQMPWENMMDLPLAFGVLGNLKWSTSTTSGFLSGWIEAVYTNPYLYLNGKRTKKELVGDRYQLVDSSIDYNLDYIVGYNMTYMEDYGYSGYIYGPDNIVFSIGAGYSDAEGLYEVGGNLMYKVQGSKGLRHRATSNTGFEIDMSDAVIEMDSEEFMKNIWSPSGGWHDAEHLVKLATYGQFNFDAGNAGTVTVYTALGGNLYFNYDHCHGDTEFQPQMLIGAKWVY